MMKEPPTLENTQLIVELAGMLTEVDVEKQCAKIASWLKEHFPVQGIVLLLHRFKTRMPSLHTENVPQDFSKQIHDFLISRDPTGAGV